MYSFAASLTNASTGEELRMYEDGAGQAWVKGEPGDEFFIRLNNDDARHALCGVRVDGVGIGYDMPVLGKTRSIPLGVLKSGPSWSDESLITHALKFVEQKREAVGNDEDEGRPPTSGTVTVQWYEYGPRANVANDTTTAKWSGGKNAASGMHKKEQSQLRSEEGSAASTLKNYPGPRPRRGALLHTITVRYTSDFGLAVRGLLSREETGMSAKRLKTAGAE